MRVRHNDGTKEYVNMDNVERVVVPPDREQVIFYFAKEKVVYNKANIAPESWTVLKAILDSWT